MRQLAFVDQSSQRLSFFQWIEVRPLDVFDQGNCHRRAVIKVTHHGWNSQQPCTSSSPPASFPSNNFVTIFHNPDDQRLNDTLRFDGLCQRIQRGFIKVLPRLVHS